ncbi:histidine phosphatase superfamily [Suillus tomentosus]|nr:histidine phosphatase superfamily [Suillus tomentosus]
MYSLESFGLPDVSPVIPEGCGLNTVHLLMRHGARYPTSDSGPSQFASDIHAARGDLDAFRPFSNGVTFRYRYMASCSMYSRTSQYSALHSKIAWWIVPEPCCGFFEVRTYKTDYHQEIIIEENNFNNTLAPHDTVALGYSKFCDLFTEEEWEGFGYYIGVFPQIIPAELSGDLYLQILRVLELVSRVTHTPINVWNSSTDSTLDLSNITFPLNQPIYVDATHDVVISSIVTALNFTSLAATGPLPTDHIPSPCMQSHRSLLVSISDESSHQSYTSSQIAPFSSQLFLLNDGVVPLTGIHGCTEDSNSLCALASFISGMHERIGQINYALDCFANYTMPNRALAKASSRAMRSDMAHVATRKQDSAAYRQDLQSDVAVEDGLQFPTICTMAGKTHIIAESR